MVNATKDMIKRGELGDLVGISVLWAMYKPSEYFTVGEWRKKKGGGPILINTIHEADDLRYFSLEALPVNTLPKQVERIHDALLPDLQPVFRTQSQP